MEAIILLCDYAEAVNGKLYITGGGFSNVITTQPLSMSVALRLAVPWGATNLPHSLHLGLETEDGMAVSNPQDPAGGQLYVAGEFEVGRPAGMKSGGSIVHTLAFRVEGLDLATGGYAWILKIDRTEIARSTFEVQRVEALPGVQQ